MRIELPRSRSLTGTIMQVLAGIRRRGVVILVHAGQALGSRVNLGLARDGDTTTRSAGRPASAYR